MGINEEGVGFITEDELIWFTDRRASRTRSGRDARGVTTNNKIQDLGIWLAQVSSCPRVGNRTPSPFFHPDLAKTGEAVRSYIAKEESE